MSNVKYKANRTVSTDRLRSQAIWGDCPITQIYEGTKNGVFFWDEFDQWQPLNFATGALQTTAGGLGGKYNGYCATAATWRPDNMPTSVTAATFGGHISGQCDSDGDSMALGTASCPFLLTTTVSGKLWFEARIATTSILTNMGQIFVGLHENSTTAFSATCPLGNGDTGCATTAAIGWQRKEDGLAVLDTIYWDHSATQVNIQSAANASPLTQLAANTWIKLGFTIDMDNATNCVVFYVNGLKTTTSMTRAALAALTFLDVSNMGLCLAFYADSATSTTNFLYMDWWGCAQVLN